jgi:hypothetical protein
MSNDTKFESKAPKERRRRFWNVVSCILVQIRRRLRSAYCLHNRGNEAE